MCARLLGQKGFGEFGILQSTIGAFGVFSGLGLGLTTVKYVAQFQRVDPERAGRIIGWTSLLAVFAGAFAAAAIWMLAPVLALETLHSADLTPELRIACFLVVFSALSGAQTGALAGFEAFKAIARVNLLSGAANLALLAGGAYLGGVKGVAWSLVGTAFVTCVATQMALRKRCREHRVPVSTRNGWREREILWSFSIPAFLSDAVLAPGAWAASAFLAISPHGYEQMGIFSAANQWRAALTFIPTVVGQVLIPMTSSLRASDDHASIRSSIRMAVAANGLCAVPVLFILVVFGNRIMGLYGPGFGGHGQVLSLTAITGALAAIQSPMGNVITGFGRMWVGALQNGGWAVVLLSSSWYLIHSGMGAEGLAMAYLLAYVVHSVWTFWFGTRLLNDSKVQATL
jgi:O-antigen/teichoic acid export membrane protein